MKSFFVLLAGAVLGAILTFVLSAGVLTGLGAGAGIATGMKAGICVTAEAAKGKGFITAQQVDELFKAVSQQLSGDKLTTEGTPTGGSADCDKTLADLRKAAKK